MAKIGALAVALSLPVSIAIDNGLGLTPPMGWRSWNLYGGDVNQDLLEGIMDGMVSRARSVDGVPTSLCDLGYCDVGLDDNWQLCGDYGTDDFTYHSEDGIPLVNVDVFPDMLAMTTYAHSLGLTAGWYGNNCICKDHCGSGRVHSEKDEFMKCYQGDVDALIAFGYDGIKLDNCGKQRDMQLWSDLINATGKKILIENCHWGLTVPHKVSPTSDEVWCPWNFYRTSQDVKASYRSVIKNLETTRPFSELGLSFPGCWAYPDMLEVGCLDGPHGSGDPGLSPEEARSHFGGWCIVSSPLTLSHDVNNDTTMDAIWDLIANPEAIAINQVWAGKSGGPFQRSSTEIEITSSNPDAQELGEQAFLSGASQYFYKPLTLLSDETISGSATATSVAVLLLNQDVNAQTLTFQFADIPNLAASSQGYVVRDVWARQDLGTFQSNFTTPASLAGHDAAFLTLTLVA